MKTLLYKTLFFLLAVAFIIGSCSEFNDQTDYSDLSESVKDLSGEWKITSVLRNRQDISNLLDISNFHLSLKSDGSYTVETDLPFIVRTGGQWNTDDPQFPFTLTLRESSANQGVQTSLVYPIVNGVRQLQLTFSSGCFRNEYTFFLVNNP